MFWKASCSKTAMSKQISRAQALQKRLSSHAAVVLDISSRLPPTPQATHVSRQLLRSGTAAAANYGEARGAESRSDFIHKLRIVLKELNETSVWLQLIVESSFLNRKTCRRLSRKMRNCAGSSQRRSRLPEVLREASSGRLPKHPHSPLATRRLGTSLCILRHISPISGG
jgi:four helix bundle protein